MPIQPRPAEERPGWLEFNSTSWRNGARPYRCRWDTSTILTPAHHMEYMQARDGGCTEQFWICVVCDGPAYPKQGEP